MSLRISVASAIAEYTETPEEERANVLSHGAGLFFALIVAGPLILRAIPHGTTAIWTIAFFALAQIFTYGSSTFYHAARPGRARRFLLVCDHIAIYALIAGTWTPLILLTPGGWFQTAVLATIWTMAVTGTALRLFRYTDVTTPILLLYLGSGWIGVILLPQVWAAVSPMLALSVVAGGALYTAGVFFYLWRTLPFNHLYWHMFSLAGSLVHFLGIWIWLLPAAA